jgi:hypothetical protein
VYLPGRTYRPDYLDEDANISCTHGLYFTSHPRVAARWGPVVLDVTVTGDVVRVLKTVKPTHTPDDIDQGRYVKYRTNELTVNHILGIAVYGSASDHDRLLWEATSRVNIVLGRYGVPLIKPNGVTLETLRSARFVLYGVDHVGSLASTRDGERQRYLTELEKLRQRQAREKDELGARHLDEEDALKSLYPAGVL